MLTEGGLMNAQYSVRPPSHLIRAAEHIYILPAEVSGISSSCLPPDFGLHLRKQAASEEVEQPETLAEDF